MEWRTITPLWSYVDSKFELEFSGLSVGCLIPCATAHHVELDAEFHYKNIVRTQCAKCTCKTAFESYLVRLHIVSPTCTNIFMLPHPVRISLDFGWYILHNNISYNVLIYIHTHTHTHSKQILKAPVGELLPPGCSRLSFRSSTPYYI